MWKVGFAEIYETVRLAYLTGTPKYQRLSADPVLPLRQYLGYGALHMYKLISNGIFCKDFLP
jgi:hypothetical protein